MSAHPWTRFVLAALLMGLIRGPGVIGIVGHALGCGSRCAPAAIAGMAIRNVTAMSLSLAGVGALLTASALAVTMLKCLGALYLIAPGIPVVRRSGTGPDAALPPRAVPPRKASAGAVAPGIFHPNTIMFSTASAPQFIRPATTTRRRPRPWSPPSASSSAAPT